LNLFPIVDFPTEFPSCVYVFQIREVAK